MGVEEADLEIVWTCLDSDRSGNVDYTEFVAQLYSLRSSDTQFMLAYIKFHILVIKGDIIGGVADIQTEVKDALAQLGVLQTEIRDIEVLETVAQEERDAG